MASKNTSLVLGILGTGEADVETVAALLGDVMDTAEANDQDVSFVLPVTKEHFTDAIKEIADWFIASNIPFEAVTNEEGAKARNLKTYLQAATKEHSVKGIPLKLTNILGSADEGRLLLLWDDDDDECYDAMSKAVAKEVPIFDLTNALDAIVPDDGESAEGDEPVDDGEDAGAEGNGDYQPYTREELEAMEDLDDLKQIASDWDVEVAPRSRAKTYIEAILKAQKEYEDDLPSDGGGSDDNGKAQSETRAETVVVNQVAEVDLDPVVAAIAQTNELLQTILDQLVESQDYNEKRDQAISLASAATERQEEEEPEDPPVTRMPPRRVPPRRS